MIATYISCGHAMLTLYKSCFKTKDNTNKNRQKNTIYIWLQAKKLIREFYFFCHSFSVVKALFDLAVYGQIFD